MYYLDTSALVKLYIREVGSDFMVRLVASCDARTIVILSLASVEFHSAVRQRQRAGDVTPETAATVLDAMDSHLATFYRVRPVTEDVLAHAILLLNKYPLRAYDAMQLAGCTVPHHEPSIFVCADRALLSAATAEGLETTNPQE